MKRAAAPLTIALERDQLIIRVGINTIAFAAEHGERFNHYNERIGEYKSVNRVCDKTELALDVVRALCKEKEDGSTPVTDLLDDAIQAAAEDGSLGLKEPRNLSHD